MKSYSGGMRRRLDLASSMILAPQVLFLDEPTTGLDPRGRNEVWAAIRDLVAGGTTVLLTTQYLEEADQLSDRITVIDRGRTVATGSPAELKSTVGGDQIEVVAAPGADLARVAAAFAGVASSEPEVLRRAADGDRPRRRPGRRAEHRREPAPGRAGCRSRTSRCAGRPWTTCSCG